MFPCFLPCLHFHLLLLLPLLLHPYLLTNSFLGAIHFRYWPTQSKVSRLSSLTVGIYTTPTIFDRCLGISPIPPLIDSTIHLQHFESYNT